MKCTKVCYLPKIFTKIFLKKSLGKSLSIYKTVEKIVAVAAKKVVVCMDDNYFFCSFSCSVRGPLAKQKLEAVEEAWRFLGHLIYIKALAHYN